MTTCRRAANCLRHFSGSATGIRNEALPSTTVVIESSSLATSPSLPPQPQPQPRTLPTPPTPIAAAAIPPTPTPPSTTTSSSSWLNHWLHLWDQKSGTHEILQLKENVNISSTEFDTKQRQVAQARAALDVAMETFENSQLQHTQLLRSRDTWTSAQAYEFAKLLEKEIDIRKDLEIAKKTLASLEAEQLTSMQSYMNHLRRRYHEEQLWQDKWRVYSTYGTWILIGLNTMVFLLSQYMTRLRETQRMKDIQEMVYQSITSNEGTLRVIQEQQQKQMHDRPQREEIVQSKKEDGTTSTNEAKIVEHAIATISQKEASELVADETDEHMQSNKHHSEIAPTLPLSSKLHNLFSGTCKYARGIALPKSITFPSGEHTVASDKLVVATTPLSSLIQQHWSKLYNSASGIKIPRKIKLPLGGDGDEDDSMNRVEVDVPSAILGASVAGFAWIIVNVVAPSRS